ncbi:hypothetical protein BKA70DRAFT_1214396 [Coprinopsis sp. MPI-PUGE-AT-0042]|nr:hypothetical protein BKA70DRAFT_1214396 [Coprinopsis sp. MPI-PUGE-AT-0042]
MQFFFFLTLTFISAVVQAAPQPFNKVINAEVPYVNGPNSYWAKREVAREARQIEDKDVPYENRINAYWVKREAGIGAKEVNTEIPYDNGPKSYWVKGEQIDDKDIPYENGPKACWVKREDSAAKGINAGISYVNGHDSYWVKRELDAEPVLGEGPKLYLVRKSIFSISIHFVTLVFRLALLVTAKVWGCSMIRQIV